MRRSLAPVIVAILAMPALAGGAGFPPDAPLPRVTVSAPAPGLSTQTENRPPVPREEAPEFFPPTHVRVTFPGQPDPRAVLNIYPVSGLLRQYPEAGPFSVRARLDQLRVLLRTRPALASVPELPYLPLANAAQVLHAAEAYLSFPGGSGLRSLTIFRQDFSPFLRREVLYTFQGLSTDGRWYVSLTFPAEPPVLPARLQDIPAAERHLGEGRLPPSEEERVIRAYLRRVTQQLGALTSSAELRYLDAAVQSLRLR